MNPAPFVDDVAQSGRAFDTLLDRRTRRRLLTGGAAVMAGLFGRPPKARADVPFSPTRWLVHRITMGWTPEEQALADSLGYQGYLEHHLNYTAIDDSAIDARVAAYSTIAMQPYQLVPSTISNSQCINELIETTVLRSVFSKRQLFQRIV
jgi:hypothetical protein